MVERERKSMRQRERTFFNLGREIKKEEYEADAKGQLPSPCLTAGRKREEEWEAEGKVPPPGFGWNMNVNLIFYLFTG